MSTNERSVTLERPLQKLDERIRRTRQRLGIALLELLKEKALEEVTVQEVLDKACVGRSTFYVHFRDKNDLLLSQFELFLDFMSTMLSARQEQSRRVVPVTEMFDHLAEQRKLYRALAHSGSLEEFYDLAQGYFARGIERRLRESNARPEIPPHELTARSVALAGSLLSLLRWWMDRGSKEPAAELDRMFHRMVWDGLR
jgi:AcrR family transcriptional regulator